MAFYVSKLYRSYASWNGYCNSQLRTMEVASNECKNKYVSEMIVLTCSALNDCFMMLATSHYLGLKESMGWTLLQHNSFDLPLQMAGLRFESVFTFRKKEIMMWSWTATGLEIRLCKCETSKCRTPVIEPSMKIICPQPHVPRIRWLISFLIIWSDLIWSLVSNSWFDSLSLLVSLCAGWSPNDPFARDGNRATGHGYTQLVS